MATHDRTLIALLSKAFRDLRDEVAALARTPGPRGSDGRDGLNGAIGPVGPRGAQGATGPKGPRGPEGQKGVDGKDGRDGKDGEDGKDGAQGEPGPMPKHQWRGTKLRFQLTSKRWGEWVDLQGPRGSSGGAVVVESDGSGSFPDEIALVNTVVEGDEMIMMRNNELVKVRISLGGGEPVPANVVTVNGVPVRVNGQYVVVGV